MSAFGLNRYAQKFAVAVKAAGTRIADKAITCVDQLATDIWNYSGQPIDVAWRFLYPFVGGTAVSHSFNLADPAVGRITWVGGVTHDSNGITGDGTTGYGKTNVTIVGPNADDGQVLFGCYSRTASAMEGSEIANYNAGGLLIYCRYSDGRTYYYSGAASGAVINSNSQGLFTCLRTTPTDCYAYRNGTYVVFVNGNYTGVDSALPFMILAYPGNPDLSARQFSSRNLAFALLSNKYPAIIGNWCGDQPSFYNCIQAFQNRLGRAV